MKAMQKLKAIVAVAGALALTFSAQAATIKKVKVGKVTWTLSVEKNKAIIGNGVNCAVSPRPSGALKIPAKIGKYSVWSIGANAFLECSGITSVAIPKGVARVRTSAFEACANLKKVTFPSTLKDIGNRAFYDCTSLTTATLPSSLLSIGTEAFGNCAALTSVSIPKGVTIINDYAFRNCTSLTEAVLANGVTFIGECAFSNCFSLASLQLPTTTLRSIGPGAFYGCRAISHVDFAATLEDIGYRAFNGATGLWSYTYRKENQDATIDSLLSSSVSLPPSQIAALDKRLLLKLTLKANNTKYGTVSGGGWYEYGTNVTIKAKAKSGYVFSQWCIDKKCTRDVDEDPDVIFAPSKATPTFNMPKVNKTLYAKFITKSADKKALKFSSATKKLAKTASIGAANQDFGTLKIGYSAKSACTFSAKGLPTGMTISSSGVISGTPKAPGKYIATVTVKSAGGNKISQKVLINIAAPEYVKGTYYGYAKMTTKASDPLAEVRLSVDKWGGVSAKFAWKGKTYSATSKCSSADDDVSFFPLTVKVGKTSYKFGQILLAKDLYYEPRFVAMGTGSLDLFAMRAPDPSLISSKLVDGEPAKFADFVDTSVTLTDAQDMSGLAKGNIKLNLKFKDGDVVYITGKARRSPPSAKTWS